LISVDKEFSEVKGKLVSVMLAVWAPTVVCWVPAALQLMAVWAAGAARLPKVAHLV
jgi:hypothetical protein